MNQEDYKKIIQKEYTGEIKTTGDKVHFDIHQKGAKDDSGKNRLGLVLGGFPNALWGLGQVGTFGANKYTDNGWQSVEDGYNRYQDALFRHLFNYLRGEDKDNESQLPHLFHALWNICAMIEFKYGDTYVQ